MKNFLNWILSVFGYGAYTLVILVVLLWVLFPTESFRVWLEAKLDENSSSVEWKIGDIRIGWPLSVVGRDIKAVKRDGEAPLMIVDELKMRPDVLGIRGLDSDWPLSYRAKVLGGIVKGDVSLNKEPGSIKCSGTISNVQVSGLDGLWQLLDRKVIGDLSGSFNYDGKWQGLLSGDLQTDLVMADGSVELLQPVFGLESLEFNRLSTTLLLKDRVATVDKGKVDSNLFAVEFSGTVTLADDLLGSGLDMSGAFEPRPELLGNLKDATVVQLIKGQLRDDKLMFTLSDTLQMPGITFQGVSGVIDGVIQGSGR